MHDDMRRRVSRHAGADWHIVRAVKLKRPIHPIAAIHLLRVCGAGEVVVDILDPSTRQASNGRSD